MRFIDRALLLSPVAMLLAAAPSVSPVVNFTQGAAEGIRQDGNVAFLGIPYAAPPIGAMRWRAPAPAQRWSGIKSAKAFGAACYQSPARLFGPYTEEFLNQAPVSEDCLTLNVWSPRVDAMKRPVLVFIHGGGFGSGAAAIPLYDGAALARRGVVVVTINYRLGVFGFLAHPDLTRESGTNSSGNYGVLDMTAALRWVHDNIARVGGDPANVTIAGESAGAAAVNDLLLAPGAKGLFQKAFAMSGSGMGVDAMPLRKAEGYGLDFLAMVNAPSLSALRAMSPAALQQAADVPPPSTGKRPTMPEIRFAPNNDGVVVRGNIAAGQGPILSNVPLLTGFNADEGTAFGVPETAADFVDMVRDRYGDHAERLLAIYPHGTPAEIRVSVEALARDRYMTSLVVWTRDRVRSTGERVYLYSYDHPYPPAPGGSGFGAFHTASVPYLFGNLRYGGRTFGKVDEQVSRRLQDHVIAFMQRGNPSTRQTRWPTFTANGQKVMAISGAGVVERAAVSSPDRFDAIAAYRKAGGKLSLF